MVMDPYKELGVSRTVSDSDLQKAFRKLAKQYHPDTNQNNPKAEDKFKRISSAYDFLSDPQRRKRFDRGEINEEGQEMRRPDPAYGGFSEGGRTRQNFDGFDFSEVFETINGRGGFGQGQGRASGLPKGEDLQLKLEIDWVDSLKDHSRRLKLEGGKSLDVNIPKGCKSNQVLRLKGQGRPSSYPNGPAGDALIELMIRPHPLYEIDGFDARMDLPVSIYDGLLGGKVEAPTPDGLVSLNLPKDSNSGTTLRLKSKGGINPKTGERGDLFVRIILCMPDTGLKSMPIAISDSLNELMNNWRDQAPFKPSLALRKK